MITQVVGEESKYILEFYDKDVLGDRLPSLRYSSKYFEVEEPEEKYELLFFFFPDPNNLAISSLEIRESLEVYLKGTSQQVGKLIKAKS